ncbi:MAG: amino acid permease [Thermoanaerobaculia bacterium]|nr:amino acid permease [Thermoanaerobaculia bacterium]
MLSGALTIIDEKQVALAVAARDAAGQWGLGVLTVAAGFATAAAINSTLFSTSKLAKRVADDGELPAWFDHRNEQDIPDRAVIILGTLAALLAVIGSLSTLVEAASLAFLFTFAAVNWIAAARLERNRWIPWTGIGLAGIIAAVLVVRLSLIAPLPLVAFLVFATIAGFGRPAVLRRLPTDDPEDGA